MFDQSDEYILLEEHLGKSTLDEVFAYVSEWPSADWVNIKNVRADVERGISEIVQCLESLCTDDCILKLIPCIIERHVLQILHDEIMAVLYKDFEEVDANFFSKCRDLNGKKLTAEDIHLSAPIVEMANLDSLTNPKSKLDCLIACFDLLYAELKLAIAEEIADSDKENEIPIVDNVDVLPILMCVIVQAKPMHYFSNIEYIRSFCKRSYFNDTTKHIFKMFETAAAKILRVDTEEIVEQFKRGLNQKDLYEIMMQTDGHIDRSMKMVTRQIFASLENCK